jgi:hypothetical protein
MHSSSAWPAVAALHSMTGTNVASYTLQQSFMALPAAIEQTANAMAHQGASTQQVSAYVQEQIDRLSGLTGGSQQAAQAVADLQQWENVMRGPTEGLDQETHPGGRSHGELQTFNWRCQRAQGTDLDEHFMPHSCITRVVSGGT